MDVIMQEYRGISPEARTLPSFAQGQVRPAQPMSIGAMGGQPMMGAFTPSFTPAEQVVPPAAAPMGNVPLPPRIPGGQTRGVREPGFFERLFGGTQYQSNSLPVNAMPQGPMPETGAPIPSYINWANAGGPEGNAADFFAADKLLMQQNPAMFGLLGGTNG
jgi:hypothetical protein